jgi:ABC-type antimicrobial peptide transport system permease subunit
MLAFGVPLRAVVAQVMAEAAIVGLAATGVGVVAGYVLLGWILDALAQRTLPDIGVIMQVGGSTVWIAAAVGVAALSISPLLLVRRITTMDLPDTLRLVE